MLQLTELRSSLPLVRVTISTKTTHKQTKYLSLNRDKHGWPDFHRAAPTVNLVYFYISPEISPGRTRPLQKSDRIRSGFVYWTNAPKQTHLSATFFYMKLENISWQYSSQYRWRMDFGCSTWQTWHKAIWSSLKGRSTTHALIDMLHHWHAAVDSGSSVRVLLVDFAKAFDHIDHNIVIHKLKDYNCQTSSLIGSALSFAIGVSG